MDPTQTPHPSLGGVPAKESPRGLHVDSTTPRGLHVESRRNLWGRVKSSANVVLTKHGAQLLLAYIPFFSITFVGFKLVVLKCNDIVRLYKCILKSS